MRIFIALDMTKSTKQKRATAFGHPLSTKITEVVRSSEYLQRVSILLDEVLRDGAASGFHIDRGVLREAAHTHQHGAQ